MRKRLEKGFAFFHGPVYICPSRQNICILMHDMNIYSLHGFKEPLYINSFRYLSQIFEHPPPHFFPNERLRIFGIIPHLGD